MTVDGNKGLWNAVGESFGVSVQHCWSQARNIVNDKTVKVKDRMEMRYDLKKIWDANGYKNARKAAKKFADKWNKNTQKQLGNYKRI